MGRLSKTARASMIGGKQVKIVPCPKCGEPMVATKVVRSYDLCDGEAKIRMFRGMYWVCSKCEYREKI